MWIATAEETRGIDLRAQEKYGLPAASLMESAGRAVAELVRQVLPKGRVAVVCGKGNNGGDGLVAARVLRELGYPVRCVIAAGESELSADMADQLAKMRQGGLNPMVTNPPVPFDAEVLVGVDLIVDALLGIGASGEPTGTIKQAIEAIRACHVPVVSVDVPSGIDADTGKSHGIHVIATHTVTFGLPKPFLFEGEGADCSGKWIVDEIGIPAELLGPTDKLLLERELVADNLPRLLTRAHKRTAGRVLIVAGSARMPGAAVLAARGALRAGAGLVTVASVASVCDAVAAQVPEAMLLPLGEEGAAAAVLEIQESCDAAVFGPGLGRGERVNAFLSEIWAQWARRAVIDADALNALADGAGPLPVQCALTPHPGELARLLKKEVAEIEADRFGTANEACEKFAHPVLLKGACSLISAPGIPLAVNPTGNPGMATGGMGDVLSGVIAALLAQGMSTFDALACGAYWHGFAGDLCASEYGPVGFGPQCLADKLPKARATIQSG